MLQICKQFVFKSVFPIVLHLPMGSLAPRRGILAGKTDPSKYCREGVVGKARLSKTPLPSVLYLAVCSGHA